MGVFFISITGVLISIFYGIYGYQNRNERAKIADSLVDSFNISTLYSQNNSYTVSKISQKKQENAFVIGIIKIDSIKISYPILSKIDDELLKISPCRFYGPLPNEIRKYVHCSSQLR